MKVIDLLNKIANGEEVPKKIKYNDKIWRLASNGTYFIGSDYGYDFWLEHGEDKFENEPFTLNDEVEIIEEPQEHKIPEKLDLGDYTEITSKNDMKYEMFEYIFNKNANAFYNKINEILDYLEVNND